MSQSEALELIKKLKAENDLLKLDYAELTKSYYDVLKKYGNKQND